MISRRNSTLALAGIALTAIFSVASVQARDAPKVKLSTSMGDIVVQLDPAKAPKTVENFLGYVKDKTYDGTVFHRVIDGFMIQGCGYTADLIPKPTGPRNRKEPARSSSNASGVQIGSFPRP